jgi:hypothetical protein
MKGMRARTPLFSAFLATLSALLPTSSFAALRPEQGRTIAELSGVIPLQVLRRSVSASFYKSLLISPLDGWVVVRARLAGTRLRGARVIQSSPNDAYDSLALKFATEMQLAGHYSIGQIAMTDSVLMHLLIYKIADGTMAISFAHLDSPGGSQMKYFGSARLAVLKRNGDWVEIKGPERLQGKGWAVRESGVRSNLRFERVPQHYTSPGPL